MSASLIILTLLSVIFTSFGYAQEKQSYLLHHSESVSRDYFYIHLDESLSDLTLTGMVGGEHQTHYRVLGFSGDNFQIEVESLDGVAYSTIDGEGLTIERYDDKTNVKVMWDGAWIDIAISASTFTSGFMLRIEKVIGKHHSARVIESDAD